MKEAEIKHLVAGHVAYFRIVNAPPPKHTPAAWVNTQGPAVRKAVKVFGNPPDRDGPMLCVTVFYGASLWAPLGHGETSSLWAPITTTGSPRDRRIDLAPEDWEIATMAKLRRSFVSLESAFLYLSRDLPAITTLDSFSGPRPLLGSKKIEYIRTMVESLHRVVWKAPKWAEKSNRR